MCDRRANLSASTALAVVGACTRPGDTAAVVRFAMLQAR
jgi:hypothetical protein